VEDQTDTRDNNVVEFADFGSVELPNFQVGSGGSESMSMVSMNGDGVRIWEMNDTASTKVSEDGSNMTVSFFKGYRPPGDTQPGQKLPNESRMMLPSGVFSLWLILASVVGFEAWAC